MVEIEQIVCRLRETVDLERLRAAWQWVVDRHEALRTEFRWEDRDEPAQVVVAELAVRYEVVRHESLSTAEREAELGRFLERDRVRGFALATAPLTRWTHFVREPEDHVLVWTFHHALLDGRSFTRVLREAFERYDAQGRGRAYDPPAPAAFRRHCEHVAGRATVGERAFWSEQLAGLDGPTPLPTVQGARNREPIRAHQELVARLSQQAVTRLGQLGAREGFTLANALQGAWALILARHARTDDVCFGSTRAGRHASVPDAGDMTGCLINTLPMRVRVPPDAELCAWLRGIRAHNLAARPFEQASLTEIKSWSDWPSGAPLFETLLVFERYLMDSQLRALAGPFEARRFTVLEQSDFPLVLAAYQDGGELILKLEYDPVRCERDSVARVLSQTCAVLDAMADDASARLRELPLLTAEQRAALLASAGGDGPLLRTDEETVVGVLCASAAAAPRRTAVKHGAHELSYGELERRSAAVASALIADGIGPGDVVAVMLPRSLSLAAAMLGVLRAGAVYLPIDLGWPTARISMVLQDAGAKRVLSSRGDLERVPVELRQKALDVAALEHAQVRALPALERASAAYLIYTSGSTGRPKGVRVSHGALLAHARAIVPAFQLVPQDRCLQFTSPSFDVSLEEMIPTWMIGATLVLRSEAAASELETFLTELEHSAVTVLNLPAAFFTEMASHLRERSRTLPPGVRLVVVGGERPSASAYAAFRAQHPAVRFLNAYGPTETTITTTLCDPVEAGIAADGHTELPIGKPLGATRAYVLDANRDLTPIGICGELFLGGPQVALGYHGQPELTARKFVPSPFQPGERLFRTGDLARRLPSGHLEFQGRVDEQVKIRGFRIEPSEIEAALRADPRVLDAAVAARPDPTGSLRLIAWISTVSGTEAELEGIQRALASELPAYMLPAAFAHVNALPLTPSGKIDKRALIEPLDVRPAARTCVLSSDLEVWVAALFAELLGRTAVSADDSFFDLGGHSLLAIRLLSRLNARAREPISLSTLFSHPTVRELARALESGGAAGAPALVALNRSDSTAIPFFCICGVQLYTRLARAMEPDRRVYGAFLPVEADMLTRGSVALNVSTMAAQYIELIRSEQPSGPYLLGGVSFGGLLAYEIAQQLHARGERVALLSLFDAILPRGIHPPHVLTRVRCHLRRCIAEPRAFSVQLLQRLRAKLARLPLGTIEPDVTTLDFDGIRDEIFRRAAVDYDARVGPYQGRVVMFAARDGLGETAERVDPDRGWSGLLPAHAITHEVSGTHLGILDDPGAFEIARVLRAQLRDLHVDRP